MTLSLFHGMSHRKLYWIFVSKIWMLWIDLFRWILIFTAINTSFLCVQCEFIMRKAQSRASPALNVQNWNVCMNLYTSCEWRVTSRYEMKTGEREKNWEKVQVYCVPRIRIAHQLAWFVWHLCQQNRTCSILLSVRRRRKNVFSKPFLHTDCT